MCTDRHHAAAVAGFLVKLVEVHLDLAEELRRRVVAALDQQNIVIPQRVGDDDKILAVNQLDERFVPAEIIAELPR